MSPISPLVTANCLIKIETRASIRIFEVTRVYEYYQDTPGLLTLTRIDDDARTHLNEINRIVTRAEPLIIREVDCMPLNEPDLHSDQVFVEAEVRGFANYGDSRPRPDPTMRPIALTILRVKGARGLQVLMKIRSGLADNDSFGRYSFLSTRILTEDVARAKNVQWTPHEDIERDFHGLWADVKGGNPWMLDADVFLTAATRDVYASTLLELPAERFQPQGMHVVPHPKYAMQMCFVVFVVDLSMDEVVHAQQSAKAMFDGTVDTLDLVTADDIVAGRKPTNGFTEHRREWLREFFARG